MVDLFRVTAKALLYFEDKALLIQKPEGRWDLPGGRLDPGERPEAALRREIAEELGIRAEIGSLVDCAFRRRPDMDVFIVSYQCATKAAFGDIRLSAEHIAAGLFAPQEVDGLAMVETYKDAVRRGFQSRRTAGALDPAAREAWLALLKAQAFPSS